MLFKYVLKEQGLCIRVKNASVACGSVETHDFVHLWRKGAGMVAVTEQAVVAIVIGVHTIFFLPRPGLAVSVRAVGP